ASTAAGQINRWPHWPNTSLGTQSACKISNWSRARFNIRGTHGTHLADGTSRWFRPIHRRGRTLLQSEIIGRLQLRACGLTLVGTVHRRRSQSRGIWLVNRRRFGRETHCSVIISRVTDSGTYKSIGALKYGGSL